MYMTDSEDKKPNRKTTTRKSTQKKKPVKKETKSIENDDLSLDDAYKKKIQKALQENLVEVARRKNLSKKQVSVINSFVEEHLSCFVLLGYTVNGNPVSLVNAPTQKDSDSLGTLLQKFFIKYIDPPAGGEPKPPGV